LPSRVRVAGARPSPLPPQHLDAALPCTSTVKKAHVSLHTEPASSYCNEILESWSHNSPCSTAGILPSAGILAEKGSDVVEQQQEEEGPEQQKKLATRRRRGRAGAEDAREAAALSRRAVRRGGRRRQRSEIAVAAVYRPSPIQRSCYIASFAPARCHVPSRPTLAQQHSPPAAIDNAVAAAAVLLWLSNQAAAADPWLFELADLD
ncbi:hypothetical protein EJB05_37604, partial [Eragrostis curvula]